MTWEMVIGLEVHAQLKTKTKLFCACATTFGDDVNTNVCPVCLGLPGALPVLNKQAVNMAIMAGAALDCDIRLDSVFARKNYFYPDLPKGYQISQFDQPICLDGHLDIDVDGVSKRIGVTRIHMEEDAGKLLHQGAASIAGSTHSLVDLNRACTPLIEIVSEPDMRSAEEARAYVATLRQILRTIGVNDGNLEEGSLRVDINLSLRPEGSDTFGTRTEVKNVNSFRSIERAIASEYRRQKDILESGAMVIQETRNYHDDTQKTTPLRSKEDAHDYRYFPDPDLLPLRLTQGYVNTIIAKLPELPAVIRERYMKTLNLTAEDVKILLEDKAMRDFFESCLSLLDDHSKSAKSICKWVVGDVNALVKDHGGYSKTSISPKQLVALVTLLSKGDISGKMAKDLLPKLLDTTDSVADLVKKMGGGQISDSSALDPLIDQTLAEHPDVVEKIRKGKTASANFLMGQVMKASKGKAKPDLVLEMIMKKIEN